MKTTGFKFDMQDGVSVSKRLFIEFLNNFGLVKLFLFLETHSFMSCSVKIKATIVNCCSKVVKKLKESKSQLQTKTIRNTTMRGKIFVK